MLKGSAQEKAGTVNLMVGGTRGSIETTSSKLQGPGKASREEEEKLVL